MMTLYAGLDISVRSVAICIVDHDGAIRLERSVPSEVPDIVRCLAEFGEPIAKIGFEASVLSQHLTYGLRAAGYEVVCMEARQVVDYAEPAGAQDLGDALGVVAVGLVTHGRKGGVNLSIENHFVRALLATRKAILNKCIDLENEVRGLLKIFGITLRPRVYHGAFDGEGRAAIEHDTMPTQTLTALLDARLVLLKTFRDLDGRVKRMARQDTVCTRLMTAPGVGPITALTFKAAVDAPSRFFSSRTVAAHFGLTPSQFQSGESDNPGRISRAGDAKVRSALFTAANSMMTRSIRSSSPKDWGMRLARTKGRRRAVVAVARKLAVILHRMWVEEAIFRAQETEATA